MTIILWSKKGSITMILCVFRLVWDIGRVSSSQMLSLTATLFLNAYTEPGLRTFLQFRNYRRRHIIRLASNDSVTVPFVYHTGRSHQQV